MAQRRLGYHPAGVTTLLTVLLAHLEYDSSLGIDEERVAKRGERRTSDSQPLAAPHDEIQPAAFVFFDDLFEVMRLDVGILQRPGHVFVANDEVEEGLDVCLGCWRGRRDTYNMQSTRGRLAIRYRLARAHVASCSRQFTTR